MDSIETLKKSIEADAELRALREFVESKMREQGPIDPGHDLAHFLRVALWTLKIVGNQIETREAIAAALLHDIINVPKNSPLRKEASRLCAEEAERVLPQYGFSQDAIARISEAIRCHSFSRGEIPKTPLAMALQDADRLEALGSIGIMRCISVGARMNGEYFHSSDPWAKSRALNDSQYSIDHFYVKLLKLPDSMTTAAGRAEAQRRAETMRIFLERLGEELGEPAP
ncbi:MAG: HD domain-containing protein [Bdellovibrionia bacterium]